MTSNELKLEDFEADNANCKYEIENISNEVDYLNPFENSWTTWGKEILSDVIINHQLFRMKAIELIHIIIHS